MAVSIERWKKHPREPPEGSAFKDGLAQRTVDDWLARRAGTPMRNRVDKVFNQTLGIPLELPERIRPPTCELPRQDKPPVKQHQVDEPIDLGFLEEYDQERPDTAASRPGTAASRPGTAASRPGTAASRPGTAASRPGTGQARPGTGQAWRTTRERQAARPGTAQARAAAAIKAAGGLENILEIPEYNPTAIPPAMVPENILEIPEYNPTAIPPAMVPEGWLKTEGGALGEIPIKPHRTPRKVSTKTKKKLINLNPSFNPPRELTSYEFVHALSEVMPALYRKVVEVTKAKVFPNLLYVSEYADDLKKVDNSEWGKHNLKSEYMRANEQLEGSESTEALARHKADLFFNWARQNGLYYGEMLTPENISKVDDWFRHASPEERTEVMDVIRTMYNVVDPLGTGAVRVSEGSVEHRQMRPIRPSTATKERTWEYKHNLDLDGKAESGAEAMARKAREVKARSQMEKDNMARRKNLVEDSEEKVRSLMEWRKELLREFTPAAFAEKEAANKLERDAALGLAVPEIAVPPPSIKPTSTKSGMSTHRSKKEERSGALRNNKPLNDPYASTINLAWGKSVVPDKSQYQYGHAENIPGVMLAHKTRAAEPKAITATGWTTAPFGAVNYKGYEHAPQPKEYIIPRYFTDGLSQEVFAQAFIPTPNMKSLPNPPIRPLRPVSSSLLGSSVHRNPGYVAAALAARRQALQDKPQHLKSTVPLGNQGLKVKSTWETTYFNDFMGKVLEVKGVRPNTSPLS